MEWCATKSGTGGHEFSAITLQKTHNSHVLRTDVIFFYLSNEGVSLLENAAHLGLPIPRVVKRALKQLHDKSEDDDKEDKNEEQ